MPIFLAAVVGAWAPSVGAAQPCWQRLVEDWSDGAISNLYPIDCYREALRNMPDDVRLYSSASDDISRALASQAVKRTLAGTKTNGGDPPLGGASASDSATGAPLVLAGSLTLLLALAGGAGYLVQRSRRRPERLRPRTD
ncbi:MAG TPA: hypothetical protein VFR32_05910 [Gaiellaceae bacterium]|nr:hypothetical protein [Gaiellaceae bacterium]